jgi:hypothetical protein
MTTTQRLDGENGASTPDSSLLRAVRKVAWLVFATAPGWTLLIGLAVS